MDQCERYKILLTVHRIFTCLEFGGVGLAIVTGYIMSCLMWEMGPGPGVTPPPILSRRLECERGVATWEYRKL